MITHCKLAYRIRSLMADEIDGVKYIRTTYYNRTILPKSLAPVFLIPTCDPDVALIVVQFTSERSKKFSMNEFITNQIQSLLAQDASVEQENRNIWIPQFMYKGKYNECQDVLKIFGDGDESINLEKKTYMKSAIIKAQLEINTPIFEDRIRIKPKEEDIVINGEFLIGLVNKE